MKEVLQRTADLRETPPVMENDPILIRPQRRQLNMRVDADVAECFQAYCRNVGLTQNLALNLLLKSAECSEADNAFQNRFQMQEQTIKALRQELKEVKHENAEKQRAERERQKCWVDVMQQFVGFIAFLHGEGVMPSPAIKPLSFRRGKLELNMRKYQYPEKNGCAVIYLDGLVYGKGVGAPLFILGHTANSIYLKIRWYPRSQYIGVPPKMEAYAKEGSRWVVAYITARDGAMDLFAALPLLAISDLKYGCMEPELITDFTCTKMLDGKNFRFEPGEFDENWSELEKYLEEDEDDEPTPPVNSGNPSLDEMIADIESRR